MNIGIRKTLLLVFCAAQLGNMGCTTLETVHGSPEALAQKKIRVGDRVTLEYVSGYSEEVKLTEIGTDALAGIAADGRTVEVDYADLLSLKHKRVEVLKTAGAAVGLVAAGVVLAGAVAVGTAAAIAGGG